MSEKKKPLSDTKEDKNNKWEQFKQYYYSFSVHFGYICGVLTIIGLIYGIVSYNQTVKPLVDEKKLKEQISMLEENTKSLLKTNESLDKVKSELEAELSNLQHRKSEVEVELQANEEHLKKLQDEVIMANADGFMAPIINDFLFDYVYPNGSNNNLKEKTLEKLDKLMSSSNTETQNKTINLLKAYVNEEIDQSSKFSELYGYKVYITSQQLKK